MNKITTNPQIEPKLYYVVTKTERGWKLAHSTSLDSLESAKLVASGFKIIPVRISTSMPRYIGNGWHMLNPSDFVD